MSVLRMTKDVLVVLKDVINDFQSHPLDTAPWTNASGYLGAMLFFGGPLKGRRYCRRRRTRHHVITIAALSCGAKWQSSYLNEPPPRALRSVGDDFQC